jgi:CBS domain-containing protein
MRTEKRETPKSPLGSILLSGVMTVVPVTADVEASIISAARLMLAHAIGGLPVLRMGIVAGVISQTDLLARLMPRERAWWWRAFADHERLARECARATAIAVGRIMSQPAVIAHPDDTIETAAALLHEQGIGRLPVVDDSRLVGIVTRSDLLRALVQAFPSETRPGAEAMRGQRGIRVSRTGSGSRENGRTAGRVQ